MKHIKSYIVLIVLFFLSAQQVIAKDLYLKLIDQESFDPLQAAYISYTINGQTSLALTTQQGVSAISNASFPMKIEVSYLGYEKTAFSLELDQVKEKSNAYYYTKKIKKTSYELRHTVITGRATPILSDQSVYNVKTITEAEIQKRGAVSLNEVLQYELNQFVSNDNILGSNTNIGGINGQNVKILINGVPLNGSEAGFIDLNQINLSNVKKIETVQGPMSVMYGSNALGGVINIITKEGKRNFEGSAQVFAESVGRINVNGAIGLHHKRNQFRISLGRNFFQGWSPDDTITRWLLWKPKTQYTTDLSYKYTFKKGSIGIYSFYLGEVIEAKGAPFVSPYRAFALDDYFITNRIRNTLNFDYQLGKTEMFTSQSTFSNYNRIKNKYYKDLVSLEQSLVANDIDQDTSVFNQYHFRGAINSTRYKNVDALIGYETSLETSNSSKIIQGKQQMVELGLFGSAAYTYKRFKVMPSLRLNMHSRFNSNLAYGLHLNYANKKQLLLRASLAKGYRAPTMKEFFLEFVDNNHMILGNPNLRQEEGYHTEVSLEKSWNGNKGNWKLEGSLMANQLKDKITLVTMNNQNSSYQYFNLDRFRNRLANISLKYKSKSVEASAAISGTQILESTGYPTLNFYELIAGGTYTFPKIKTNLHFMYRYNKNQPIYFVDGSFAWSKPLHISTLSISKSLLDNAFTFQIGVKNLFNIQNNLISESVSALNSPHGGDGNTTLLLPRTGFINILYKF